LHVSVTETSIRYSFRFSFHEYADKSAAKAVAKTYRCGRVAKNPGGAMAVRFKTGGAMQDFSPVLLHLAMMRHTRDPQKARERPTAVLHHP
jgi:hypothetical protein